MIGIQSVSQDGSIDAGEVFSNKIFRNIVLSLAATYGLYIVSSLLALDPWHMREYWLSLRKTKIKADEQSPVSCNTSWCVYSCQALFTAHPSSPHRTSMC